MQFTAWPEMLAWPYLLLKGFLPYQDIAIAHNPLLLILLSVFYKIFGVGVMQLQVFTIILITLNFSLLFFVVNRLWNKKTAVISLIAYGLLLFAYDGFGLWFDLALVPSALLIYYAIRTKKYLLAGTIFAIGFLTKQTFVYFLIPIIFQNINIKKFTIGVFAVFTTFALYLFTNNLISSYLHWAVEFGIFYLPKAEGQVALPNFKQFFVAIVPFVILIFNFPLALWALAGSMGVYPRWELFHFQPALPFVAISISIAIQHKNLLIKYLCVAILLFAAVILVKKFYREQGLETRFYETEVSQVVSKIVNHPPKIESLYIVNYWDNIYALTNTVPHKPLIAYIPWYISYEGNKQLIINNLKLDLPDAIVVNQRQNLIWDELRILIDRYYTCNTVEKEVEVCFRN